MMKLGSCLWSISTTHGRRRLATWAPSTALATVHYCSASILAAGARTRLALRASRRTDPCIRPSARFGTSRPTSCAAAFERLNGAMARVMLTWPIGKLYQAVIDAKVEWTLEHLAFMNVVPYRTRPGKHPPKKAMEVGWRTLVKPSLEELDPDAVRCD